jgi:hypothetical protein
MIGNTHIHCPPPHNYDDTLGTVQFEEDYHSSSNQRRSPSVSMKSCGVPFPWKLHEMLDNAEKEGFDSVVSWLPGNDNAFRVHDIYAFVDTVMTRYFNQTKYKSFQRQLNLWGFRRVSTGPGRGGYSHSCFIRDQPTLCIHIRRQKIKGKQHDGILLEDDSPRRERLEGSPQYFHRFLLGISSQHDQDTTSRGSLLEEWLEIHKEDNESSLLDVFPANFDPESIFS